MNESEKVFVFIQADPQEERQLAGSSVKRIVEIMDQIKAGKKPEWNKIYNTKNNN